MPNTAHRWTDEELEAAVVLDKFEAFTERFPGITRDAYRLRRAALLRPAKRRGISLRDELIARKHTACKVCAFLKSLPAAEAAEWAAELAQPVAAISHLAVVDALLDRRVRVEESSVRRHRRNHGK